MADETKPKVTTWTYDPGESPKKKHGWNKNEAGFIKRGKALVGKCPKGFSKKLAQDLINNGIPEINPRATQPHPMKIYVVHDGVLYRAVPTEAGKSYHGFPERPRVLDELDDELKAAIWNRARKLGQKKELTIWLRRQRKA